MAQTGTPRSVAERCLVGIVAWRGAVGLFGLSVSDGHPLLHGAGLVARNEEGSWLVTEEGQTLLCSWQQTPDVGLVRLAEHLVRESPWLRLLLLRLRAGDWKIEEWAHTRSRRSGLKAGGSLILERFASAPEWFAGVDQLVARRWLVRTRCSRLGLAPALVSRKKGKDDLSLSPLTAPLHLLESVGWLSPKGTLQLPAALLADLVGQSSAAESLTDISARRLDVRGFVAAEPVLRELLEEFGVSPAEDAFSRWMDEIVQASLTTGALEILSAEPGQARHGRGLFGDPARKLVRWVVHQEFNKCFQSAWASLGSKPIICNSSPGALCEELTR